MPKKKHSRRSRRASSPKERHIHYFFVIISVVGLGMLIAGVATSLTERGVLGVSTLLTRSGGNGGTASANAEPGSIQMGNINGPADIHIDNSGGQVFEDASGSNGSMSGKLIICTGPNGNTFKSTPQACKIFQNAGQKRNKLRDKTRPKLDRLRNASNSAGKNPDKRGRHHKGDGNPDKTLTNLLQDNIISHVATGAGVETGTDASGNPVLQVVGVQDQKLFGFIPVGIQKTVQVSPTDGSVVKQSENPWNQFLDFLSF